MLYSLLVVQPRAAELLGDGYERLAVALAAGARRPVLAVCAALAISGGGLVAVELAEADDPSALWTALVVAKSALLVGAVVVFVHVSWRLWPVRLFARPEELPAIRRRFRRSAVALTVLVGAGLVLGAVADALR